MTMPGRDRPGSGAAGAARILPAGAAVGVLDGAVALHFLIAYAWATAYFVLYQRWARLRAWTGRTSGAVKVAAAFGIFVWLVMDLIVVPLSRARPTPVASGLFWIILIGHTVFVGLPVVLIIRAPTQR